MPKAPRFQSPKVRQFVVSLVMTLLLAISLLLAVAFSTRSGLPTVPNMSRGEIIRIGQMHFQVPSGWQPQTTGRGTYRELGKVQINLTNPQVSGQLLTLALLPDQSMRSPTIAMAQAQQVFTDTDNATSVYQNRFREHALTGIVKVILTHGKNKKNVLLQRLVVMTVDGSHYQVIHHQQAVQATPPLLREISNSDQSQTLVMAMVRHVQSQRYRTANARQLAQAHLAPEQSKPNWELATDSEQTQNLPLWILPTEGRPWFWQARFYVNVLPDAKDPHFSPQKLLENIKNSLPERLKDQRVIEPLNHLSLQGWKLTLSPESQKKTADGLVRETWYITDDSANRAIVAELVAEPQALSYAVARLTHALSSLKFLPDSSQADQAADTWPQAVKRGTAVVARLKQNTAKRLVPDKQYKLLFRDTEPMGLIIEQTGQGQAPLLLRGRVLMLTITNPAVVYQENWTSNTQITRAWISQILSYRANDQAQPEVAYKYRFDLHDDQLDMYDFNPSQTPEQNKDQAPKWTYSPETNYLPGILLDDFPADALAQWSTQRPCVVMFSNGQDPPEPWWFEVHKVTPGVNGAPTLPQIHWCVNLRPVSGVHITSHWVDTKGRIIASQWLSTASDGGVMTFDTRPVDRPTLIKAFNQLEPEIAAWETEWPEHAQTQPSK